MKGGVLMDAWSTVSSRPTVDIDFLGMVDNDPRYHRVDPARSSGKEKGPHLQAFHMVAGARTELSARLPPFPTSFTLVLA